MLSQHRLSPFGRFGAVLYIRVKISERECILEPLEYTSSLLHTDVSACLQSVLLIVPVR